MTSTAHCRLCERTQPLAPVATCDACGGPIDVRYDFSEPVLPVPDGGPRSMWRYRHALPFDTEDDGTPGLTPLVRARRLSDALGVEVHLKLETANPTHSFKDRVAAAAVAAAQAFGFDTLCCASTGNLADALAARCASSALDSVILCPIADLPPVPIPAYGARVFAVEGSYDDCRRLEQELAASFAWGFVGGNLHALASEGAKTIAYEIAEQLGGRVPDAVVTPAASGTLLAKLAQGFDELLVAERPRLYGAQAGGCPPLAAAWADDRPASRVRPATEVRSLAIGDPAFGDLAIGAARMSGGAILAVPEEEIAERTRLLATLGGVYADSAGGVATGALIELIRTGAIREGEQVVLVVTGTGLKPYGFEVETEATEIPADIDALLAALGR
jgi:threonine synthase